MNRDEKPKDPFSGLDPVENEVKETAREHESGRLQEGATDGYIENFAAWLELELEKLETLYQGFSTSNSRRNFFGR